jgi:hypothetical protein
VTALQLALCLVLGASMLVGLVLPAARRPVPHATGVCVGLLALAFLAFAATLAFAALDTWPGVPISAVVCLAAIFVSFWFAASPEDEDEDEDGGGGPRKGDPEVPRPRPPSGPAVDWREFDRLREGWSREREPVGV